MSISLKNLDGGWNIFSIEEFKVDITAISFGPPSHTIEEMKSQNEHLELPPLRFVISATDGLIYEWI